MKIISKVSSTLRENSDYLNWRQALHCSVAFLGVYIPLYSAQNTQAQLFEASGYDKLGLVSNSLAYVGQGTGSIFSVYLVYKIGIVKSMAYSSLLSIPFILSLIFPTLSRDHPESVNFIYSNFFIWTVTIVTTFVNGFG